MARVERRREPLTPVLDPCSPRAQGYGGTTGLAREAKCHKNPMTEGRLSYETRSAQPSDALTREPAWGSRLSGTSTMYSGTY